MPQKVENFRLFIFLLIVDAGPRQRAIPEGGQRDHAANGTAGHQVTNNNRMDKKEN
jgi:hypothetical protein